MGQWKIPLPFPEVGSTCGRAAAMGSLPALRPNSFIIPPWVLPLPPVPPAAAPARHQPLPTIPPAWTGHRVGTWAEEFLLNMEKGEQTPLKSRVQALIPEPFPKMGLFYRKCDVHIPVFLRVTEQLVFHR